MLKVTGKHIICIPKPVVIGNRYKGPAYEFTKDGHIAFAVMQPPNKDMLKLQKALLKHAKELQKNAAASINRMARYVGMWDVTIKKNPNVFASELPKEQNEPV